MKISMACLSIILVMLSCSPKTASIVSEPEEWAWETVEAIGTPTARHEAGLVAYKNKLLLIGGRRINPTSVFDITTNTWTEKSAPPIELHHFQPVVVGDAVYLIGAMTGGWPNETPLERVLIYYPERDEYVYGHDIPANRRRGGAGTAYYNGKIYLVGGITRGHMDGFKPWLDAYDPVTGEWEVLPDAPSARDHFHADVAGDKLYAFGGRTSYRRTNQDMNLTIEHGNIYDFNTGSWESVTNNTAIPTMRAGSFTFVWKDEVVIGGGESTAHVVAHNEIEAYNTQSGAWRSWPSLQRGRHGTGLVIVGDYVYTASGCGNRGGEPELSSIERLKLPTNNPPIVQGNIDKTPVYKQWHTITLTFEGLTTSESAEDNPFLNYSLQVEFTNGSSKYMVRGFYAADGNAAETSAENGNVWKVRFTPDAIGEWSYSATLYHGEGVALANELNGNDKINISNASGTFIVTPSDKDGDDFRARGRIEAADGYFRFRGTDKYWLKGGTNSPENLLAYKDFDGTYRMLAEAREGEAEAPEEIHEYAPHLQDWVPGDPSWQGGKGKALIGAMNYLASTGMNSDYFLLMNILGDGKDVWPFVTPYDFTRFDVSRLAQWEILFQHMQSKGILLHMVLQETENETMFDNGDTGPQRQLYFRELIARFGHHLALVWNLGEENGPASWTPVGQNDAQRKSMTKFLKANDPYNHPVLLHTHSHDPLRSDILNDILGDTNLDGLSLQVDKREGVAEVVQTWREKAHTTGQDWLITMDEIGMWHTGAVTDEEDPDHHTLRRYALWGSLLSGGAGVEWYFGAKHPQNDLTSEDWRKRDNLWKLTKHARTFFEAHLPYWEMKAAHKLVNTEEAYCLQKPGEVYAIYLTNTEESTLDLTDQSGEYELFWYDPILGGQLQRGSVQTIMGGSIQGLGVFPTGDSKRTNQDWVVLVKRK